MYKVIKYLYTKKYSITELTAFLIIFKWIDFFIENSAVGILLLFVLFFVIVYTSEYIRNLLRIE